MGGLWFPTKTEAKNVIRRILRSLIGQDVRPGSEHFKLISGIWERSALRRPEVSHFIVIEKLSGMGIRAVIGDNSYVDFSVRESISGHSVSHWTKLTSALRLAIRPQIREFKAGMDGRCAICDCSGWMEADHYKISFRDLMRQFLAGRDVPNQFEYCAEGYRFTVMDSNFEAQWLDFHKEHCSLRLLCPECHKRATRRQQRTESE